MRWLGLRIKLDSFVAHMFYAWSFSHNTAVPISIKKNKYFISLNTYTNDFAWGGVNSNKISLNNYIHIYDKNEINIV